MASIWDSVGQQPTAPTAPVSPAAGSGFFNPSGNYGQTQDWWNTPISENMREQNPRLAFNAYGSRLGIPENDNTFSRWFYEQQFPRFQSAHGQAIMHNPLMTIDQFINTLPNLGQLRSQYAAASPSARGAQYSVYSPNVRWIPR